MTSPSIKIPSKNGGFSKHVALLLTSLLLVWPTLVAPTPSIIAKSNNPSPRTSFTPTLVQRIEPFNQEMFATYFLSAEGFNSKLIVHNQRIDVPVTFTPVMLVEGGREIPLNSATLEANCSLTIDLNEALISRREKSVKSGGLVLRYAFPETGPINATVTINHSVDKLSLMSPVMARAEFMSNVQEGVFWLPDKKTDIFVAIQNTSAQARHVTPTLFAGGQPVALKGVTLAPRETAFLDLSAHMRRKESNSTDVVAGAIRLINDGTPGDVMAEGGLVNHSKGFSKRISFMDTSLHFYDMTLRANFLFLGDPPPEFGFPPQVSFLAVCAMRNTAAVPVEVHPLVKYLDAGTLRQVRLPDIRLQSSQVRTLDLFEAQRNGAIPAAFRTGTLELECDGPAGSLIAELTNLDTGGGYVLGSSFSGHPSKGVGGTFWRIDEDWQSIITLTNAATAADDVSVELFYEGGSYRLPSIAVAGGSVATINLKELGRTGTPDSQGNRLPPSATSGSFCVIGSNELRSAISMERLIFNSQTSECIVIDGTEDHYVTSIAMSYGIESNPVPLTTTGRWNDGSFSNMTAEASYSSNNTAFVQVSGPSATVIFNQGTADTDIANVDAVVTGYGCARGSFASVRIRLGFSYKKSAYLCVGREGNSCLFEKTCDGKCSVSRWSSILVNGECPTGDYQQCYDLLINGNCVFHHLFCYSQGPIPGVCTQ